MVAIATAIEFGVMVDQNAASARNVFGGHQVRLAVAEPDAPDRSSAGWRKFSAVAPHISRIIQNRGLQICLLGIRRAGSAMGEAPKYRRRKIPEAPSDISARRF